MTTEEAVEYIRYCMCEGRLVGNTIPIIDEKWQAGGMAIEALEQSRWIPLSERPMTDEERKEYGAEIGFVYDCELPEDSQDVLVTTPYGVRQTTFYTDYGCYFENYEDEGEVIAWMPLPQPYKADKEESNER